MSNYVPEEISDRIIACLMQGKSTREVCSECKVSKNTVGRYFKMIRAVDAKNNYGRWEITKGNRAKFIPANGDQNP